MPMTMSFPITPKDTIEREAREAAQRGDSINDACRYPFGSPQADHFKAVYLLSLPVKKDAE